MRSTLTSLMMEIPISPHTSLLCVHRHTHRGFIRLITNKKWAWAISTCIDSLMGSLIWRWALVDVELLLCVAKWINQSKQTTGRRNGETEPLKLLHLFFRFD